MFMLGRSAQVPSPMVRSIVDYQAAYSQGTDSHLSYELISLSTGATSVGTEIVLDSVIFGLSFERISALGCVVTAAGNLVRL